MFELADIERDPAERRRLLTFVVAGGGYAGTEIAGELADFVRLLTKREYSGIRRDECRVVIVHPGPTLLPELYGSQSAEGQGRGKGYAKLVEYATKHSRKLGVELLLETRVAGATPLDVYLSNGEHVPTRTIVSAVGTEAPPLFDTIEIPRDERGRVAHGRLPARRGLRERLGRRRLRRGAASRRRHLPAGRHLRAQARRPDRQEPRAASSRARSRSRSATRGSARACRSAAAPRSAS